MDAWPPRFLFLHGFELNGSGSNLYTAQVARALRTLGAQVSLLCHEPFPERLDFVDGWATVGPGGLRWQGGTGRAPAVAPEGSSASEAMEDPPEAGSAGGVVWVVRPEVEDVLGEGVLAVFNEDVHEGFRSTIAYPRLSDAQLAAYVDRHADALEMTVRGLGWDGGDHRAAAAPYGVAVNHVAPLAAAAVRHVADRRRQGAPVGAEGPSPRCLVVPHGSGIEYGTRLDPRLHRLAVEALGRADGIVLGGPEVGERVRGLLAAEGVSVPQARLLDLPMGIDTTRFRPRERQAAIERLLEGLSAQAPGATPAHRSRLWEAGRTGDPAGIEAAIGAFRQSFPRACPDADAAARLARGRGLPWIVYAGKLVAGKGVHLLLATLPALRRQVGPFRLVLAGEGSFRPLLELLLVALAEGRRNLLDFVVQNGWRLEGKDPVPVAEMVDLARAAGGAEALFEQVAEAFCDETLLDTVVFAGWLGHDLLAPLVQCAGACVLPSQVPESSPLVIGEALAAGVPIVVSDAGGSPHLLARYLEGSGLAPHPFVVSRRPEVLLRELPEALARSLRLPAADRARLAEAAGRFSWHEVARRMLGAAGLGAPAEPGHRSAEEAETGRARGDTWREKSQLR